MRSSREHWQHRMAVEVRKEHWQSGIAVDKDKKEDEKEKKEEMV